MKYAILLLLLSSLLLSGCNLQDSICIQGKNLTYDGVAANGELKISVCNDDFLVEVEKINVSDLNMTSEELQKLPIFEGVNQSD